MSLGPNTCLTLVLGPSVTESGKQLLSEMTSIGVKDGAMLRVASIALRQAP